ncbi:enoyl-CoA hydratase/isomerase family protein [Marinobacter daepoensis]|uniref:Enoyl-CoA hydratase/isomerase family protein n=1 Tax=Marinobacter daepoensis TaxID=262077 RepID=A0ABS3B9T7_9GAMM|nr:enoyl-CoA hydratase/isomerase family protein [Marinobacter daepoensis]MBN7768630.1 enoyl-CoA hydratase/isomerase family protein [Marinobacter daepoensis]MBY6032911.1 enoyl-CoA hydratase/isomerase family protein [Marinobacter daepoensis]MBY6079367.1 enoyl-CoA hydratase/isomerase family protein [Marinobacter daepoensis]
MTNQYVHFQRNGDIVHLTLARPERHNALVPELLDGLLDALKQCHHTPPRVIVLAAEGRSFSSGGDVRAFFDTPRKDRAAYARQVVGKLNEVILAMLNTPAPIVSAIQGLVTGGSLGLVLGSDIVIASTKASFAPWYTVVGFSPDGGWSNLMGQRIGASRALEIQLTNRTLTAHQAYEYGLAHYLVEPEALEDQVQTLCQNLCAKQPESVLSTLRLNRPAPSETAAALKLEYDAFVAQIQTEEAHTGMARFLKQAP